MAWWQVFDRYGNCTVKIKIQEMIIRLCFLSFILLSGTLSQGQTKYEREYRIRHDEVPEIAHQFIRADIINCRLKWYYEENLEGNSIEAKFKLNRQKYSVEFDTAGKLQDIEIEYDFEEVPQEIKSRITKKLQSEYEKHAIRKIQFQYSGAIASMPEFLQSEYPAEEFTLKYELVAKGKKEGDWNLYELTFDADGKLEDISRIILRNSDNLEF